jgi:orotate phosphoribosyltransferase-like protein
MADIAAFKENIINSGYVLDPEGVHHEFVSGMHGQKLDFDNIEESDPLYSQWTEVAAGYIEEKYDVSLPEIIIGVANGTNRTALDTARRFGGRVLGLVSEKDPQNSKKLWLSGMAANVISAMRPNLVVVLEDVGTTGSNSVQVATACRDQGAKEVEVVTTWKRREKLERLEEAGVPYRAIIDEPLPTYSPEDCKDHGFCSQGYEFIER